MRGSMRVRALLPAAGLTLCCNLLGSACSKKEATSTAEAPPPIAAGMARPRPTPTSILPPVGNSPDSMGSRNSDPTGSSARFDLPPPRKPDQAAPLEAESTEKARDYSAELSTLLKNSAQSCLAGWDPSVKTSLIVQITAQVMGSGAISRAEAQAPGATPAVLACLKKQANALQLVAPVEGAPRSVSASVTLQTEGSGTAQPKAAAANTQEDRDENPRDSKLQDVENDPREVVQKEEPVREAPEPPEPRELPPTDDTRPDEQP